MNQSVCHKGLNVTHLVVVFNGCKQRNTTLNQDCCGSSIRLVALLTEYHIHQILAKSAGNTRPKSVDLEDRYRQRKKFDFCNSFNLFPLKAPGFHI